MAEKPSASETQRSGQPATTTRDAAPAQDKLLQLIREITERIRNRQHRLGGMESPQRNFPLPDLMPLVHARDAALGKVAAIGTVNPRPPGLLNDLIQLVKRFIARILNWHVREQIEFNRATVWYMEATLEALEELKQTLAALNAHLNEATARLSAGVGLTKLKPN